MSELVGLEAMRAACQEVIDDAPMDVLVQARDQVRTALAELCAAVGNSHSASLMATIAGLDQLLTQIDAVQADLVAAADHARSYQARL